MKIRLLMICLAGLIATNPALAHDLTIPPSIISRVFNTKHTWHIEIKRGSINPISSASHIVQNAPATICFSTVDNVRSAHCSTVSQNRNSFTLITPKTLIITDTNPPLIEFTVIYSNEGSGALTQYSLWQYESISESFAPAGEIILSEQGEYSAKDDWIYTADAILGARETHFSPHRFTVKAYRIGKEGGLTKAFHYITNRKYPSLDDVEKINVLPYEMPNIQAKLKELY